ncbi:caspase-8-like [Macrosteles quadrilineatus]|uniref:caspase-8-like n=1 Tax=Macrosteles quadrilineatus TaxID=74068 RepID=UPI0023E2C34E|nr:caspase-8-like [Macrosteles quadrilineatus]
MDMGNYGFPKFDFPNYNEDYSEESDSETSFHCSEDSDCDRLSTSSDNSNDTSIDSGNATFDSAISVPEKKYHLIYKVTLEDVSNIEMNLDLYEYISVIFLLIDDTRYALQLIRSLIAAGPENFSRGKLYEWACTSPTNWKFKLFETLAIIQNNNSLMRLGCCIQDINIKRDAPVYTNRFKKILYSSVCDFLKREPAQDLIDRVRRDGKFKEDITLDCDPMYMEFHILFWISQEYISIKKEPYLDNLMKQIKSANLLDIYYNINEEIKNFTDNECAKTFKRIIANEEEEDCYKIKDPNNPGLVVVVNNAKFYNNIEKRKEFEHKLPKQPRRDRMGSDKDVENLSKTFKSLNYNVVVINDVNHDKMVDDIRDTVRNEFNEVHHSVLVLCVLSHGDKGMVYGANSVPVKNEDIINSISGSSPLIHLLSGIPKVIIIQACQGPGVLYVNPENELLEPDNTETDCPSVMTTDDNLTTDGPNSFDPKDRLVCMATIDGFVSIRSKINGTKYIQELCRCIDKYHRKKHFLDIITKVHKHLSSEKCIVKDVHETQPICMVPVMISNLCKSLYLTPKHVLG